MAKVTIYLPDKLAERVRAVGVAMSAVCQVALQEAVERVTAETLGMERIEVELADQEGAHPRMAAFTGRWLVEPADDIRTAMDNYDHNAAYGVAFTKRNRIAVYSRNIAGQWGPRLDDYDSIEAAVAAGEPQDIMAEAAAKLDIHFAVELDI